MKIFSTVNYPDPFHPWAKRPPQEFSGTGVVIDAKRILTNAHVVSYAGDIEVQANQSDRKIAAHVIGIAPGIDLAEER